jgi:hypothetical protein
VSECDGGEETRGEREQNPKFWQEEVAAPITCQHRLFNCVNWSNRASIAG